MLDIIAAVLSGGRATHEIPPDPLQETALSQVFIAVDVTSLDPAGTTLSTVEAIVETSMPPEMTSGIQASGRWRSANAT